VGRESILGKEGRSQVAVNGGEEGGSRALGCWSLELDGGVGDSLIHQGQMRIRLKLISGVV
jgi:hypothetical protein